jgi:hypothetical protein
LVALAVGLLAYGGLAGLQWWLVGAAHDAGLQAMHDFPGDETEALSLLARDEHRPLSERNRAIWALAQLADSRALPALERLRTGRQCEHERFVCQYELQKAIDRCSGRSQPPRWLGGLPLFPHPTGAARRQ